MNINSKIYIAGHNGMVGSALLKSLTNKGYNNIIFKSSSELDLRNPFLVKDFYEEYKPEYVFLAAARVGGIIANNKYRADFIYDNLMIQSNIIHNSYLSDVKKMLFLGSTCIYPRDCKQPMKEEYLLNNFLEYTNEPYAISKIAGIKMCESYNIQHNTNFISVMPTNLYGPNDNFDLEKGHVLPALLRKIHLGKCLENNDWISIKKDLNKRPIEGVSGLSKKTQIINMLNKYGISFLNKSKLNSVQVEIWGSGKPLREFLWSEEMSEACIFLMNNVNFEDLIDKNSSELTNTHINIGSGEEISIKSLAFLIKEKLSFKGNLFFNSNKPDGNMRKLTDVSKLNKLGWKHNIGLNDGIVKLYDWYNLNLMK